MLTSSSANWYSIEGQNPQSKSGSRGQKRGIQDTEKDSKYWERRKKNNLSAKKSREKSKQVDQQVKSRCIQLEYENSLLRREIAIIKSLYRIPPGEEFLTDRDREECSNEVPELFTNAIHNSLSPSKELDIVARNFITVASPPRETTPDTTTSPAPVNQINTVNKRITADDQILVDAPVRPQEYVWNRLSEPGVSSSPSGFYRPMEEDSNSCPTDLSVNKKALNTEHHKAQSDRDVFNSKACSGIKTVSPTVNKSDNYSVTISQTLSPEKTQATYTEMDHRDKSDEGVTVLDLTCDDDDKDIDEDLNMKLKSLADQIVAMQTLVNLKTGVKQE